MIECWTQVRDEIYNHKKQFELAEDDEDVIQMARDSNKQFEEGKKGDADTNGAANGGAPAVDVKDDDVPPATKVADETPPAAEEPAKPEEPPAAPPAPPKKKMCCFG